MKDDRLVYVGKLKDIPERCGKLVIVDGEDVALFRRDKNVYALSNLCSHQHFSMLHKGEIDGLSVSCPMHGWTYDMTTGIAVKGNGRVKTYRVKVVDEEIFVEPPDGTTTW